MILFLIFVDSFSTLKNRFRAIYKSGQSYEQRGMVETASTPDRYQGYHSLDLALLISSSLFIYLYSYFAIIRDVIKKKLNMTSILVSLKSSSRVQFIIGLEFFVLIPIDVVIFHRLRKLFFILFQTNWAFDHL